MNFTKILFSACDLLRRESSASRIGAGVALGFLIGFTPLLTLQGIFYLCLAISLRVNLGMMVLSTIVFSFVSWGVSPLLQVVGHWLLTDLTVLSGFWTLCYHSPLLPLTRFNHTAVMGGLATSLFFAMPLYWLTKLTVIVVGEELSRRLRSTIHNFSSGVSRLLRNYDQHSQNQTPA